VADYGDRLAVDEPVETQNIASSRVDTNQKRPAQSEQGVFFIAIGE